MAPDVEAYLAAAGTARHLIAHPRVAQARDRPSALAGFTVGGLAAHRGWMVVPVADALAGEPPDLPAVSAEEHYRRAGRCDAFGPRRVETGDVPRGLYSLRDHDGAVVAYERFSCAPGPAGWRYNAQVLAPDGRTPAGLVDITTDASGRQLRVEVRAGGWTVRGGVVGGETVWVRTGASGEDGGENAARAVGFAGRSPGFLVAVARLVGLRPGASSQVRLVSLIDPAIAPVIVDGAWSLATIEEHPTESGPLSVERYETADLASGRPTIVHLVGDVVLAAPGIELETLDTPPTFPSGASRFPSRGSR